MSALRDSSSDRGDDAWYVTDGVQAEGPVSYDQLQRSLAQGRILVGSMVRHASWRVWRPLQDIDSLTSYQRQQLQQQLADVSADARAEGRPSVPAPSRTRPSVGDLPRTLRPAPVDPVGVFSGTLSLDAAYLVAVTTCVSAASASLGVLYHRFEDGSVGVACTVGAGTERLLGHRLRGGDPCLGAALEGWTVVGDPVCPGGAGEAIAERLGSVVGVALGLAMIPLRIGPEWVACVELGRRSRPFTCRELARAEDVLEALAERIVVAGWID